MLEAAAGTRDADESSLASRMRAGDAGAFADLVHGCAGALYATARRLLRSDADAADAVQDALVKALRSIDGFRGDASLLTWLRRIVTNEALMRLRGRGRRGECSIEDLQPRFADDGHRVQFRDAWQEPADALLARREVRDAVRRNLDRLQHDYRTVLLLRDVEGFDTQHTAALLGTTPGAVKVRLHRARLALRELMERELAR